MKKIGFLPTSFEINRKEAGNITTKLLTEQLVTKYEVYIFTGNIRRKKKIEIYNGINIIRLSNIYGFKSKYNIYSFIKAFMTHIYASYSSYLKFKKKNNLKLDVVIGVSSSYLLVIRTLLFKLSNKNIKTIHILKSESSFCNFKFKFLLNKLDAIIVQNEKTKNELIRAKIKTKIELINSFIDTNKFIKLKNIEGIKKKYDLENKRIILYYGHFNKFKGIEYLIKAFSLVENSDDINLVLIPSDDSQKNNYNDLIKNHIFKNRIKILPANINIVEILNISEMVVLPYPELISTESNPSCIIESLSCGVPVITSDLLELKEVFKSNILYSKPKNIKSIAEKINFLLNNQKIKNDLITNGISFSKKFDINVIKKKYFDLIEYVTNGK